MKKIKDVNKKELIKLLKERFKKVFFKLEEKYPNKLVLGHKDLKKDLEEKLKLKINHRLRSASGRLVYNKSLLRETNRKYKKKDGEKIIQIEINPETPFKTALKTFEHESLHFLSGLGDVKEFKMICKNLDIPTNHKIKFKKAEKYKYKINCKNSVCDYENLRKRRTKVIKRIENYRCPRCSDNLIVISI